MHVRECKTNMTGVCPNGRTVMSVMALTLAKARSLRTQMKQRRGRICVAGEERLHDGFF